MRTLTALIAALMLALVSCTAAADEETLVRIAPGSLKKGTALALAQLLEQAMPQAAFVCADEDEGTLWQQVLSGEGPQLAICTAQEAVRFASEGLILPLDMEDGEAERIADAVLDACTQAGEVVMAPLYASHRRMAVSKEMIEDMQLGALLDTRISPVWQPMQLYQVLEEATLSGGLAMELWPCGAGDGEALLAFVQALYGGVFALPGGCVEADNDAAVMAVEWLCDMVDAEMIGLADSREEALRHFLDGETALFIDWTDADAQAFASTGEDKAKFVSMPYPSSLGVPVRDAQVTGVVAFRTGDSERDALLAEAAILLAQGERAQRILGERAIYEDDALWLSCPGAGGSALRGLMGAAIDAALAGEIRPEAAMRLVQAAYEGGR